MAEDIKCAKCGEAVLSVTYCRDCGIGTQRGFDGIDDDTPLACGIENPEACEACQ